MIGVNYEAFSIMFPASLAGLGWTQHLLRKGIKVRSTDSIRNNLPVITVAMVVGCSVLLAEVYISRANSPFVGLERR